MPATVGAPGLLAEPEQLEIGQQHELAIRGRPSAVEVGGADLQGARQEWRRGRSASAAAVAAGKDVTLFEQLREAIDLIGGDGDCASHC